MNTDEEIITERRGGLGFIILNRPHVLNILNSEILQRLGEALADLENDKGIKAVIITGKKDFSAGADIRELKEKDSEKAEVFSRLGHRIFNRIENMEKVVIAAVNGYALGGGCELALACDMRIAGENAKFGQPEINLGLIPGFGATQRLPRLVGLGRAKEMILTGRVIDAKEAESIGLVTKVVKDEELLAKAEEIASGAAQKSPLIVKMAKTLLNEDRTTEHGFEHEIALFSASFSKEDHLEGINAFLEKRTPKFKGR